MIDYIYQKEYEVKHISLLRKAISQKLTGCLHLRFSPYDSAKIEFCFGDMVDDGHLIDILRTALSSSVFKFGWEECRVEGQFSWLEPTMAIVSALAKLPIDNKQLQVYHSAFSGLPEVSLKAIPIHRYNFGDESEYQSLYHMSLRTPTFKPAVFLDNMPSEQLLLSRTRAILLAFLLGYLVPAPKEAPPKPTKRAGIAARILNRFRGA